MPDSNITLRAVKGAALTHTEMDTNFQEFFYSASVDNVALNLFRSQSDNPSASLDLPKPKGKTYAIQLKSGSGEAANAINFTGSNSFTYDFDNNIFSVTGSSYYSGDVVVDGRMTAKVFQSQTIISSTSTGSTSFGDTADDRHLRTGSHHILGNSSVVGNKDVQGVLSITGWSDVSSSLGHLYNFSSSLDNFYVKDAHYLATRSIDSASAHTDRVARVAALSASSHSQRSTLYNYNSASIVELSGAAHTQRDALDSKQATANATLSGSIHTAYLKNTTDSFTGTLTVVGDADANDVTIDGWGSISASLAQISSSASGSQLNIANNADNRLVTAQGTDYLNAEANLTFNGTHLSIGGTSITNYTSGSHPQIVGLVQGTQSGSLLEAYEGGNFVLGIRDNSTDGHDNFAVVSGDGGYYSGNQYTKLAFKVSGSGATYIGGKATIADGMFVTGSIDATGDITAYYSSDERLKDNITPIVGALDKINQIGGYEFDWNNNSEHSGHDVGVIAQEIEKVLPELVVDRDNGYKAVRYEKIVALLIEAIKQQQLQIDELKSKI